MRTCPECGKDTDAGMAEPCTKCGFSPLGDAVDEPFAVAVDEDYETIPELAEENPEPSTTPPPPETVAKPKRNRRTALIWVVIALGAVGLGATGVFASPTGPDPDDVEASIVSSAAGLGAAVTVDCPDDAEDTEVGETFLCEVTAGDGRSIGLRVRNNEDDYTWRTAPLARLARSVR